MNEDEIFGSPMKVREAIALLAYGVDYAIKGAYSGKIYHRSWQNKKDHVEQFYDREVTDNPFFVAMKMQSSFGMGEWCKPVIVIWMQDYIMCKERKNEG